MGGVVDYGVGTDTKTSPRRAAIEKAQADLRQEYDVREERKRELEFLEKGGNPLDFKLGHAKSISRQSTSLVGPHSEQCAISEAKGSFALSASPQGDSIESSGRPGGSLCRDTNIADNLQLFDGENSKPCKEKNGKRRGKRVNASLLEQSSEGDGRVHAKGTKDSLIFHLGGKSQAYARRNRSRSNRDTHNNKAVVSDHSDANRLVGEAHAENHGASYVSDSKAVSPNGNVVSKISTACGKLDMEIDGADTCQTLLDKTKDGLQESEVNISESMQNTNNPAEQLIKNEATSVDRHSVSLEPTGHVKGISSLERFNSSVIPEKDITNVFDDLMRINCGVGRTAEVLTLPDVEMDALNAEKENKTSGSANDENCDVGNNVEHGSNGVSSENPVSQRTSNNKDVIENGLSNDVEIPTIAIDEPQSGPSNLNNSIIRIKDEVELSESRIGTSSEVRPLAEHENLKTNGEIVSKLDGQLNTSDSSHSVNKGVVISGLVPPTCEPSPTHSKRGTSTASVAQNHAANQLNLAKKAREDAILKEARMIEANLKRTAQLSTSYKYSEKRRKCHWDFVLEEMAWMANDFMQERLWKTAAAAHICHQIASTGRSKLEHEIICWKQRNIATTLAKAVMQFWHSAGDLQTTGEGSNGLNGECCEDLSKSCKVNGEAEKDQAIKCMEMGSIGFHPPIEAYAVRFLKYDCSISTPPVPAEAPNTPERVKDAGIPEKSWESELSDESLFYAVPPGAMQVYRETVESQWLNYQKMVSPMNQEDCEASPCNSLPDGPRKNEYEEEEGETGSYFLPGAFQAKMPTKFPLKKKKNFPQRYAMQPHNSGREFSYEACLDGKSVNHSSVFMGKRPSNNINAGPIPTKRIRTASRQQRVVSPFAGGNTGSLQLTNKTDASSGDTSSIQDDQSSMHGGSQSLKNMDIESTADFDKQLPCDGSETSTKSKKKSKHLGYSMNLSDSGVLKVSGKGSMFDQRFKGDSMFQQEQVKKRLENQHYESNGNLGLYGQHASKKLKLLKQPSELSQEAIMPANGSISSPVASQMSNMSNQHKFIKIIAHRDRGRKNKAMKMAAGQSGSGTSWTTFEDQALVVFVHDMGPNWELVSDAINNTLQFKCIFRKPQECKERHKFLMEKSAGDGADSAEDSGSSQPYPSTLPGIPKGSARQLFQRLQGPMEEDTLKGHFEKIILIGQKLHSCRSQKDTQVLKQTTPVHSSHFVALSQTCPNNLGGGVLSPLDLCDTIASSPDVLSVGYQTSQTTGAAIPSHQGSLSPILPTSSPNPMLPGSSGVVLGSNLSSPSSPLNAPASQRYSMSRAASLPGDDQQKMHYAQMLANRNIQQASMSVSGAFPVGADRGTHMIAGANGMGMMGGRPIPRPGFAGMMSTGVPMVSNGSMLAGGGPCVSSPASVHPAAVSGPGHTMSRPRDALHAPRPGQNAEDHRQMMMQDIQLQSSQGNGQAMPPLSAVSAPFSTTGLPSSMQSYPAQPHHQPHQMSQQPLVLGNHHHPHVQGMNHSSPQQQAYAIRLGGLANERQPQQRMTPQSQQPFSASSGMSPVQSNSQVQQQTQASPSAPTQAQHSKQQMSRNPQSNSGMPSQVMKQRQQQQAHQQQPRHLQQQKQLLQQQAKLAKGLGSGPMMVHQNLAVDPSQVSGLSVASRNQVSDKHLMQQSQGFFSGPLSLNHHKLYPRPSPQSSKQMPPLPPAHSEGSNQSSLLVPGNHTLLAPQQTQLPSSNPLAAPSPPQQQRQINQNMQRMMLQQNRQTSSDGRVQSSGDQVSQMVLATSLPRTESSNAAPLVSSAVQRKPEPSYDVSSPAQTTHLASSPSGNLVGLDTLVPSSIDGSAQKPSSGSVSMDGHGVGGPWHPQQPPQSQPHLLQQQQQQPQHSHRQGMQGNLYPHPSHSGPG